MFLPVVFEHIMEEEDGCMMEKEEDFVYWKKKMIV